MSRRDFAGGAPSRRFRVAAFVLLATLVAGFLYAVLFDRTRGYQQMNMSCFVFRDVNRNGVYDMPDRPYAGMKVKMRRPAGGPVEARSNISGFANFKMSYGDDDYPIYRPGKHAITVEPPDDWVITTGNASQSITFRHLAEAPVGMVGDRTYQHVGVAPRLQISGSVEIDEPSTGASVATFQAIGPGGETSSIELSETGRFSFAASPGVWKLAVKTENGRSVTREVTVAEYPVVVSRIDPGRVPRARLPRLRKVGFDDLTPSATLFEIPRGYAGLNWNNWVATHQKFYGKTSHVNGTVSSEYLAYTSSGHPAVIWSENAIDFVGVFVSMTSGEGENHDLIIRAWRNGELAYEDRFRASISGPVYFAADYRGVTEIEFSNQAYWHAGIDDFEYRAR